MKYLLIAVAVALVSPVWAAEPVAPTAPAAQTATLDQIRQMLLATWQRDDDTRFTRELLANGTIIDRYEGDSTATIAGTWVLVRGDALPPDRTGHKPSSDAIFLRLFQNGDLALLNLVAVNVQALQLLDIGSGRTLRFSRLK